MYEAIILEIDPACKSFPEEKCGRERSADREWDGSGWNERTQSVFSGSGVVRDGGEVFDVVPLRKGPDECVWSSAESEPWRREEVILNAREYLRGPG